MADVKIVKSIYTLTDVTSLGEVAAADDVSLPGGLKAANLTASKPVFTDANKKLVSTGTLGADQGGTGVMTLADGGIVVGAAAAAVEVIATPADNTYILVSGAAANANPVWTAATGTGSPVKAASPTLSGTPLSTTAADNTSTTQIATTAFAKSQDAVLHREPDQGVAMTYAASGSSGITVADNDNIDFGTGNFTLVWKGSLPDWTPSDYVPLMMKDVSPYNNLQIDTGSSGKIRVYRNAAVLSSVGTGLVDGTVAEIAVVTDATTITFYVNGIQLGSVVSKAAVDVSNTAPLYIMGNAASRTAGTVHHAYTFNRALTAAEVLALYRNGIAESDKWGSQTAVYTSDFSSTDPFSETNGTGAGNIDGISDGSISKDDCYRYYANDTSGWHNIFHAGILPILGKKYKLSLNYYIPSANTNLKRVSLEAYGGTVGANPFTTTGAWTVASAEFTCVDASTLFTIRFGTTVAWASWAGANSVADDLIYLRDIIVVEIGATLALEPEGIQPTKWIDGSTNQLDASYPTTGYSFTRPFHKEIALVDPDIAHGMTTLASTDTFGRFMPISGTIGGLDIYGLTDLTQDGALRLTGIIGAADPTDTHATIHLRAGKVSGTGWTDLGAAEQVLRLSNHEADLITVLGSGNVGVGTTTPASLAEIRGGLTTAGAVLTLGSKETSTVVNDVLGRINFYAPLDASGTDAILPGASITAIATASFSSSVNSTALHFQTGNSETAVGQTRMTIGPTGGVTVGDSGTDPGLHNLLVDGTLHVDGAVTLDSTVAYTSAIADNLSTTQIATTAYAKGQDAIIVNPKAMAQGVAMTAAGSGSSGITVADTAQLDHGTGMFTLNCKRNLTSWVVAAILMEKHDDTTGYRLSTVVTTGYLKLEINDTVYTSSAAPSFTVGTMNEITVTVSISGTTTTVTFYGNGVLVGVAQTGTTETTTDNAVAFYAMGTDAVRTAGIDGGNIIFNRVLSAAEVLDLYRNGVNQADKWGSQTVVYTSDFSAGVDSWAGTRTTLAGNIDGIGGQDNNLRAYATAVFETHAVYLTKADIITRKGKRFKVSFDYYMPSANTTLKRIGLLRDFSLSSTDANCAAIGTTTDAWTTISGEVINNHGSGYVPGIPTGTAGSWSYTGAGVDTDDLIYIRNVVLTQIGATLALEPEGIQSDKWYDSSSNALDATYPTAGCTLTRPVRQRTKQPTPTAETTGAVTLTIAKLLTGIITGAPSDARAYTLDTGANIDAINRFNIGDSFEWTLINTDTTANDHTITVTGATGTTIVGNTTVLSAHADTIKSSTGTFRTVKTAAATYVSYRIA